jgi:hypothetical protein
VSPLLPTRRRRGRATAEPIPAHPYRDTAVLHGALGLVICGLALLTGGDLVRAALVALGYVVLATSWSWWHFSRRIRAARAQAGAGGETPGAGAEEGVP